MRDMSKLTVEWEAGITSTSVQKSKQIKGTGGIREVCVSSDTVNPSKHGNMRMGWKQREPIMHDDLTKNKGSTRRTEILGHMRVGQTLRWR